MQKLGKEEMIEILHKELDPDLDYFDATQALMAIAGHVRDLHRLILTMFESLGVQGAAIIDIREKMVAQKRAIEMLADIEARRAQAKPSAIILPRGHN